MNKPLTEHELLRHISQKLTIIMLVLIWILLLVLGELLDTKGLMR